jgi:hypothetical protein
MNKEFWKDFFGWIDRATVGELFAARDAAREDLRKIRDPDTRSDIRRMIRLMDEELVTRSDLARLTRKQAARGN